MANIDLMTVNAEQFQAMREFAIQEVWKLFDDDPAAGIKQASKMGLTDEVEKMRNVFDEDRENDRQKQLDFDEGISQGATVNQPLHDFFESLNYTVDALGKEREVRV